MSTLGVGTTYSRHALEIVATGAKPLPDLLDTLKAITAVGGGILLLVVLAELGETAFKDGVKLMRPRGTYWFLAVVATGITVLTSLYTSGTSFLCSVPE